MTTCEITLKEASNNVILTEAENCVTAVTDSATTILTSTLTQINGTFTLLTDTPSSYTGSENYLVRVNTAGDGLEFVSSEVVEDINWGEITGTLSNQTDLQNALDLKYDAANYNTDFDTQFSSKTTTDLTEGTNLYYTDARAIAALNPHTSDATIHYTQASISITASQVSNFDTEVSNNTDVAANTSARHTHTNKALLDTYTQTETDLADAVSKKHDAVTVTDSSEIDFTLTGQDLTASLIAGSIDETKLDSSVNTSLDLADSSVQPSDLTSYVPYTGATTNVDLGANDLIVDTDTLFVDSSTGNVGIGTESPLAPLHLYQSAQSNARESLLRANTGESTYSMFGVGNFTTNNGKFLPLFYGFNNDDNRSGLAFAGLVNANNDTETSSYVGAIDYNVAEIPNDSSDPLNSSRTTLSNKTLFSWRSNATPIMLINADGNFGIGTTSPDEKLEVNGNIYLQDNDKSLYGTGKDASIYYDGTDMVFDSQEVGTGDFVFNNGNVGIGTDSPAGKLDVQGGRLLVNNPPLNGLVSDYNIITQGRIAVLDANSNGLEFRYLDDYGGMLAYNRDTKTHLPASIGGSQVQLDVAGDTKLLVDDTGNVGIGTTTPSEKLHVYDNSFSIFRIESGTKDAKFEFFSGGVVKGNVGWDDSDGVFKINAGSFGTTDIAIDGDNVGIGTSTPDTKLDVEGTAVAGRGVINATNDTFVSRTDTPTINARFFTTNNSTVGSMSMGKFGGGNNGVGLRFQQEEGTDRLVFRGSSSPGAMVWSQPETGARLLIDIPNRAFEFRDDRFTPMRASVNLGGTTGTTRWNNFYTINADLTGTLDVDGTTTLGNDLIVDTDTLFVGSSSNTVGIGTTTPTAKLDINSDKIRLRTAKTPSSATDTGNQGDIAWDADYIYICTATDTWKRSAISTW